MGKLLNYLGESKILKRIADVLNVRDVKVDGVSVVDNNGDANIPATTQIQSDWTQADTTKPDYIKNKPSIPSGQIQSDWSQTDNAEVDYIKNKPTIPDPQIQSDWNQTTTTAKDYIKNKPTIPTVNNATLTIQKNGTTVKTFTANASSNVTCNITVPTKTSDISNDSNYVSDASYVHTDNNYTSAEKTKLSGIATGAEVNVQSDWNVTDTSADDYIKNKPTIPAAQVNADWNASSGVAEILNKPTITDEKVKQVNINDTSWHTIPLSQTNNITTETATLEKSQGLLFINNPLGKEEIEGVQEGTTGLAYLCLGNSKLSKTANNYKGKLRFYDSNNQRVDITTAALNAPRDILIPNKDGTFALTSDLNSYLPLSGGALSNSDRGPDFQLKNTTLDFKASNMGITNTKWPKGLIFQDKNGLNGGWVGAVANYNATDTSCSMEMRLNASIYASDGTTRYQNHISAKVDRAGNQSYDVANPAKFREAIGADYGVVSKTANGLAPQLPNETTTDKFLRQDGTWNTPLKVRQTLREDNASTTYDENRPLLMAVDQNTQTGANRYGIVYRNNSIYANPHTGGIYAKEFTAGDSSTNGKIKIYTATGCATLQGSGFGVDSTITLPANSGTVALASQLPTYEDVTVNTDANGFANITSGAPIDKTISAMVLSPRRASCELWLNETTDTAYRAYVYTRGPSPSAIASQSVKIRIWKMP